MRESTTIEPRFVAAGRKAGQRRPAAGVPPAVIAGLWLAIVLDTGVQLCWKGAVLQAPESAGIVESLISTLRQPLFLAAAAMFAAQFVNWMQVLSRADLSYAQPITALSYVSVAALSAVLLHEHVSAERVAGIALILAGVWLISGTEHATVAARETEP